MFTMREISKYVHDEADDAKKFSPSLKWRGTLVCIHEEGYLPSFSGRHAGRQNVRRNGCEQLCTFRTYSVSCILENAGIKCLNSNPCPDALLVITNP